jgi:hypothetical protein
VVSRLETFLRNGAYWKAVFQRTGSPKLPNERTRFWNSRAKRSPSA